MVIPLITSSNVSQTLSCSCYMSHNAPFTRIAIMCLAQSRCLITKSSISFFPYDFAELHNPWLRVTSSFRRVLPAYGRQNSVPCTFLSCSWVTPSGSWYHCKECNFYFKYDCILSDTPSSRDRSVSPLWVLVVCGCFDQGEREVTLCDFWGWATESSVILS